MRPMSHATITAAVSCGASAATRNGRRRTRLAPLPWIGKQPALAAKGSAAADHVDREGEHAEVEHEGGKAMADRDAADAPGGDLAVRCLEGHAEGEAEIDEVPVIGLVAAR